MAFIGPRPALFNQSDLVELRTLNGLQVLTPGITGWAQINGRDEIDIISKVALEIEYFKRRSLWFDLRILTITFFKVLQRKNISH
jgi:O-antigen biosynthesis protein WbqP